MSDSEPRHRPADRSAWRAGAAIVAVALVALAAGWTLARATAGTPAPDTATPAEVTVAVEQRSLVQSVTLRGEVTGAQTVTLTAGAAGRVTAMPAVGQVVALGDVLAEIDAEPVFALSGARPLWREMAVGTRGVDVLQLEEQLVGLGFDPGPVDQRFTAATLRAWNALRAARGYPVPATGVSLGSVVVGPFDSPRTVGELTVQVGAFVAAGDELVSLEVGRPRVVVTLPETEVGVVVVGASATLTDTQSGATLAGQVVALDETGDVTTAAVEVADGDLGVLVSPLATIVVAESGPDSLVVPTLAVRTAADGGLSVSVRDGAELREVPVETGLMVDGMVVVEGALSAGDSVVLARTDTDTATAAAS